MGWKISISKIVEFPNTPGSLYLKKKNMSSNFHIKFPILYIIRLLLLGDYSKQNKDIYVS